MGEAREKADRDIMLRGRRDKGRIEVMVERALVARNESRSVFQSLFTRLCGSTFASSSIIHG
jgi:hypothetical protein